MSIPVKNQRKQGRTISLFGDTHFYTEDHIAENGEKVVKNYIIKTDISSEIGLSS